MEEKEYEKKREFLIKLYKEVNRYLEEVRKYSGLASIHRRLSELQKEVAEELKWEAWAEFKEKYGLEKEGS